MDTKSLKTILLALPIFGIMFNGGILVLSILKIVDWNMVPPLFFTIAWVFVFFVTKSIVKD